MATLNMTPARLSIIKVAVQSQHLQIQIAAIHHGISWDDKRKELARETYAHSLSLLNEIHALEIELLGTSTFTVSNNELVIS